MKHRNRFEGRPTRHTLGSSTIKVRRTGVAGIVALAIALVGAASSTASAGELVNGQSVRRQGNEILITAEASTSDGCASGQICTNLVGSGAGWGASEKNVLSSTVDNKQVRAYYGETKRTSGTTCYKTSHHAVLIKGGYEGEQKWFNDTGTKTNATANTGGSSWQSTSRGQVWTMAGAGYYDHACNGSWDFKTDDGRIDIRWTTP